MEIVRIIGYARCSTLEQGDSRLGLESQAAAIKATCRARGWKLLRIEEDVSSGRRRHGRPGLEAAIAACNAGEADTIMAAKLDRLSRSVIDFYQLVKEAEASGFAVVLADGSFDLTTAYGRAFAGFLAILAELEADLISERTKAALTVAKEKGTKSGKPIGRPVKLLDSIRDKVIVYYRQTGSLRATAKRLNAENVPRPQGGAKWHPTTVQRIVAAKLGAESPRGAESGN